jgi:hypothetical protein
MKCSGSPTTSTAADDLRARDAVHATLNAVLFREILKPLAAGLGPIGETAIDAVADRVFVPPVRR